MTESNPIILPPRRRAPPSASKPPGPGRFRGALKRVTVVMLLISAVLLAGQFALRWWRAQQPPPFPYAELKPGGGNLNWLDERRLLFTGWGYGEDDAHEGCYLIVIGVNGEEIDRWRSSDCLDAWGLDVDEPRAWSRTSPATTTGFGASSYRCTSPIPSCPRRFPTAATARA